MEGNILLEAEPTTKITVVVFEPDLNRRSTVYQLCVNSSADTTVSHAKSFSEAEQMLHSNTSAFLVCRNSSIPAEYMSGRKLPIRWILYEDAFQPEALASVLRDRLQGVKNQTTRVTRDRFLAKMVGECDAIKRLRENVWNLAQRDSTVLCTGETGTGKNLVAEMMHECGPRRRNPFRTVSCPGIPETLWESELNGSTKGAFTGAARDRAGRIESAHGGTLFLDEIAEVPTSTQAKLLDFLQHRRITRVGSNDEKQVDVRVVAATNKDLQKAIRAREFREDLFYRLAQVRIQLPPLRDRGRDSVLLANTFVAEYSSTQSRSFSLHKKTEKWILGQAWRGNVRQLRDAVYQALVNCRDDAVLLPGHFQNQI